MTFSVDTKLSEILDNPAAKACLEKHFPEMATMGSMLNMARGMSLQQISSFSPAKLPPALLETIVLDLNQL